MPRKRQEQLENIRARVARRSANAPTPSEDASPAAAEETALASASAHFLGTMEQLTRNREVQALPIRQIAPDIEPGRRQPRLVPLPNELLVDGQPAPAYREMVAELVALGKSLKLRQIQPIVVYPGTSSLYSQAHYLILVGHRRWTAAWLTGLETLDAVVVDPPTTIERLRIQYAENEAREEFSDMERAWALAQMKQALGENTPWETVEQEFQISRSRRHELTRLLAFTEAQQQQVALLRLQETQVRSLHRAVRSNELAPQQVDTILERLAAIAAERVEQSQQAAAQSDTDSTSDVALRRSGVDAQTVSRLVAQAVRNADTTTKKSQPRWLPPLREQLTNTSKALQRSNARIVLLDAEDAEALLHDAEALQQHLDALTEALRRQRGMEPD
jgi:ParB/RepB/Spo0J family partition protein